MNTSSLMTIPRSVLVFVYPTKNTTPDGSFSELSPLHMANKSVLKLLQSD